LTDGPAADNTPVTLERRGASRALPESVACVFTPPSTWALCSRLFLSPGKDLSKSVGRGHFSRPLFRSNCNLHFAGKRRAPVRPPISPSPINDE
jgi:hypothetical protein